MYKLVPRTAVPPGRKRIKSKWVFKRKADGSFKGCLVAQGWNQVSGLDCGSTFAPVCRLPSVRMMACIFVHFDLKWDHIDVSTAFLFKRTSWRKCSSNSHLASRSRTRMEVI